jgi:hypothetical protein
VFDAFEGAAIEAAGDSTCLLCDVVAIDAALLILGETE